MSQEQNLRIAVVRVPMHTPAARKVVRVPDILVQTGIEHPKGVFVWMSPQGVFGFANSTKGQIPVPEGVYIPAGDFRGAYIHWFHNQEPDGFVPYGADQAAEAAWFWLHDHLGWGQGEITLGGAAAEDAAHSSGDFSWDWNRGVWIPPGLDQE